jgi:hypothetical protein
MVSPPGRTPADLGSQAARNAELRRLFAKPTIRLSDDETPDRFAVYMLDQQTREERCLGRLPGEQLARLLACLPDGAGPGGVALAICCYRVGLTEAERVRSHRGGG